MFAALVIVSIEALILTAIWRWDARSRRAALQRGHLKRMAGRATD